jgi:hypothetical protein
MKAGNVDSQFHNKLIMVYRETLRDLASKGSKTLDVSSGQIAIIRSKLRQFLKSSKHYRPDLILSQFPIDDFLEERAILMSRLKQHRQALEILVLKLKKARMAETYCDENFDEADKDSKDIYLQLFDIFLKNGELENALNLLNGSNGHRINPREALLKLPTEIPLHDILTFYEKVVNNFVEVERRLSIEKYLRKSENLQVKEEHLRVMKGSVYVDSNTSCDKCKQRIVQGSTVIVRYPNGTLIDYKCLSDRFEDPVSRRRFSTLPRL